MRLRNMIRKLFCCRRSSGAAGHSGVRLLLAGALLFGVGCGVGADVELWAVPPAATAAPDWLVAAKQADIGRLGDGNAAVVVSEWTDFTVDATGKFVEAERRAIRVVNWRASA